MQPQDKEREISGRAEGRRERAPSLTSSVSHAFDKETSEKDLFDKLPSLPEVLEEDRRERKERKDGEKKSPPLCTTRKSSYIQQGSPIELIRASMYVIPADEDMFDIVGLPMFVIAQPFNDGAAVPEFKDKVLIRCTQCSSFPTPAVDSYAFKCLICGADNKISIEDCPSVQEPTVDYIIEDNDGKDKGKPYQMLRKWKEPCVVFAIDITPASKQQPGFNEYLSTLRDLIMSSDFSFLYRRFSIVLMGECPCVISERETEFVTNRVHSVEDSAGVCSPWMLEVDALTEERVQRIFEIIQGVSEPRCNLSASVEAVTQLVSYTGGGRVLMWLGGREYAYVPTEKNIQLAVESGISLSIFAGEKTEIEKVSRICYATNGCIERENIGVEMTDRVVREGFFRCSIRVVASDGLKKRSIYSSGYTESISSLFFSEMNALTTFAVSFSVDDLLRESSPVFVQIATEYVNMQGEKRIRVVNLRLRASRVVQQIFSGMVFDSMFCGLVKYVCSEPVNMLEKIRKVEAAMVASLALYKRACAKETSLQQLVLPESIKVLPLLIQSVLKYPRIHLGIESRITVAGEVMPLSVERTLRRFYPRMTKMSSLFTVASIDDISGERLSMRVLDENDTYFLDTGSKAVLWFGRGAASLAEEMVQSDIMQSALNDLQEIYGTHIKAVKCMQGNLDAEFIGYMVEDQMGGYPSYQNYLGILHSKISRK